MLQLIEANWLLLVLALLVGLLVAWFIFSGSRRTKVIIEPRADDGEPARRNQALIDAAPVAASDDVGALPESDLTRLKGIGPKLIAQLHELGVTSVAQIAQWDEAEIARINGQLGRFAGRITRDDWVGQARLLESGEQSAYEERFGRL